jgi:NADPH:quinone reductase-like Zn-dependent oxidoreductase
MTSHVEAGRIKVVIDKVFSLNQAKEALAYSESERAKGKIVIKVA